VLEQLLEEVVQLAADNVAAGQLPFAALVVDGAEVVGRGVNTTLRDSDPTAHAEVAAIRDACRRRGGLDLSGTVVVTSCAPCPLCRDTSLIAGVERLVYAAPVALAAAHGLGVAGRWERIHRLWDEAEPGFAVPGPVQAPDRPFRAWQERGSR
jgi:tRNA(Arg) A34 adenosine deaminase TadA